jgi:hypothetical protein
MRIDSSSLREESRVQKVEMGCQERMMEEDWPVVAILFHFKFEKCGTWLTSG